jgi:hypothetical protein
LPTSICFHQAVAEIENADCERRQQRDDQAELGRAHSTACTTVVADTVVFSGSSSFNSACITSSGGTGQAKLVE